ncbi:MAG TPA: P1 family peptidase, partial [Thermomicrobiales bacterium]|nr:P1 family peptidase [Thermomicrobiales bacterium]
ERVRLRELGVSIGSYPTGTWNAITDVAGVEVGQSTVAWGDGSEPLGSGPARTGVTAIWPQREGLLLQPVAAGFFALSGTGEMTARSEIEELGRINTPIVLTNTMSVGLAYDAVCRYLARQDPELGNQHGVLIPVVAECDDEYLNDVRGFHVTHEHVDRALDAARTGPVDEGCVGSGTGMICFGYKGGIGTSSRRLPEDLGGWTVGVLTMTNFGRRNRLTFAGVLLGRDSGFGIREPGSGMRGETPPNPESRTPNPRDRVDGSCIVIVATDAPLDGRQLARLAKRAALGLGRTGSAGENGSGELLMAFSTTYRPQSGPGTTTQTVIDGESVNDLFAATIDATEEAVLNSLCMATTTTGRYGRVVEALPLDRVREALARAGRIGAGL